MVLQLVRLPWGNRADPAQLPGRANGLVDAEGIPVGVAGAVLAPAHEPGLANGE